MTTIDAIIAQVMTALTADLGVYDLSGTDQVKEGTFEMPPISARPFIAVLPAVQNRGEEQNRGEWTVEDWMLPLRLWAPFTSNSTTSWVAQQRALSREVRIALDAARNNATGLPMWRCLNWAVTGEQPYSANASSAPTWVHTELTIEFTIRRSIGT